MPTEKDQLEVDFCVHRDFLRNLHIDKQPFLIEDNTYPPPNASWWEQMGNYFFGDPPAYRVNVPLKKVRWVADDVHILVRIKEFPAETRSFQYKMRFNNWWAGIVDFLLHRLWQVLFRHPALGIGLIILILSYLLYE